MLTRLVVRGFKNLADVDIRFGAFTCIAGANGAGKSNLFDAISLLSELADRPVLEAALSVRDETALSGDVKGLFTRWGDRHAKTMEFIAEMIVPMRGVDDLGQEAKASISFLRYHLMLGYREDDSVRPQVRLAIEQERLDHVKVSAAFANLWFPHTPKWRRSVVDGRRTSPLISTDNSSEETLIVRHQEGKGGRPFPYAADQLPRTVLSTTNAAESSTAFLARLEMRSWRLLQLEPSALRIPDALTAPPHMDLDGGHLPATLYQLAHSEGADPDAVYAQAANRLSELIDDVQGVTVERDDRRQLFTLFARDENFTSHPARALSDGTLRFLALVVMEMDPSEGGVVCLEEPENGIHPARLPAILDLLQDMAVDVDEMAGPENPLRQVIINTHSPAVVQLVPGDSLVVAAPVWRSAEGGEFRSVEFRALPGTWRVTPTKGRGNETVRARSAPIGQILDYLHPTRQRMGSGDGAPAATGRVIDRLDVRQYVMDFPE